MAAEIRLFDLDAESAKRNARLGTRIAEASNGAEVRYVASPTLADALRGADFVIVSILPGTLDEMAADIEIPERYGIRQSVGDTVGPGGFVRAMRSDACGNRASHQRALPRCLCLQPDKPNVGAYWHALQGFSGDPRLG